MPVTYDSIINMSKLRGECDQFGYLTRDMNRGEPESKPELQIYNPTTHKSVNVVFGKDILIYIDRAVILSKHARISDVWESVKRLLGGFKS